MAITLYVMYTLIIIANKNNFNNTYVNLNEIINKQVMFRK